MLTRITATLFKDSVWTYIEPNAGVVSACLPYLVNVFGRRILQLVKFLSDLRNNTKSLVRLHEWSNKKIEDTNSAELGSHRATYDACELTDSIDRSPEFKERDLSHDSVEKLVWERTHVWARSAFRHTDAEDPDLSYGSSRPLGHGGKFFSLTKPLLLQVFLLKMQMYTIFGMTIWEFGDSGRASKTTHTPQ